MATEQDIVTRFKNAQDALVVQASDLSLASIASHGSKRGNLTFSLFFNGRERWDVRKQSALIKIVPSKHTSSARIFGRRRILWKVYGHRRSAAALPPFLPISSDRFPLSGLSRFCSTDWPSVQSVSRQSSEILLLSARICVRLLSSDSRSQLPSTRYFTD